MKPEFTMKETQPGRLVLYVKGELTIQWSHEFKEQLIQLQKQVPKSREFDIVISLQEATTVDVSAFQLLHLFRTHMKLVNCSIAIVSPALPSLAELITKSGWSHLLFMEDIKPANSN